MKYKPMYESKKSKIYDKADVLTYEEVPVPQVDWSQTQAVVFVGERKVRLYKILSSCRQVPVSVSVFPAVFAV